MNFFALIASRAFSILRFVRDASLFLEQAYDVFSFFEQMVIPLFSNGPFLQSWSFPKTFTLAVLI